MEIGIKSIIGVNVTGKRVLFRPDINSPIDKNGKIVNLNRLTKTVPTLKYLLDNGAKVAIIAHQGDTLDYQNLISLKEHASILSELVGYPINYIDDVCGDCALQTIDSLGNSQAIILGNLRYLTEEVSTFEKDVKLSPQDMLNTYLVRRLSGHFDMYVNDAFSAAHRNAPSMVAFQQLLPSFAGTLFFDEYEALHNVMMAAKKPAVFVLGGAKISDAFGMMEAVLQNGTADYILTCGVTGAIMLLAQGISIGTKYERWLKDKDLLCFVNQAQALLSKFGAKFVLPKDLAYESANMQTESDAAPKGGTRVEIDVTELPNNDVMLLDIGHKTVEVFARYINTAGTVFANGPSGVYENSIFEYGTETICNLIASTSAYSVIGGGDTVTSFTKFTDITKINYVCTAGGAMVRFLSGKKLPLIEAMLNAKK